MNSLLYFAALICILLTMLVFHARLLFTLSELNQREELQAKQPSPPPRIKRKLPPPKLHPTPEPKTTYLEHQRSDRQTQVILPDPTTISIQTSPLPSFETPGFSKNNEFFILSVHRYTSSVVFISLHPRFLRGNKGCRRYPGHCITGIRGAREIKERPEDEEWFCDIPTLNKSSKLEIQNPAVTHDPKANNIVFIMNCSFDVDLSDLRVIRLRQSGIIYESKFQPESLASPPKYSPPELKGSGLQVSACMSGLQVFFYCALEWVVHHLNIGIDHLYIGIDKPEDSKVWENYVKLFRPFTERKLLTLINTQIERWTWDKKSRFREIFNNQCLYMAKSHGGLLGVWDIDEFLVPVKGVREPQFVDYVEEELMSTEAELKPHDVKEVINDQMERLDITVDELCSFTFESVSPSKARDYRPDLLFMADRYPKRGRRHENDWKKSISNTEKIFANGIHVPGGCSISGINTRITPNETKGAFWFDSQLASTFVSFIHFFPTG